MGVSYRVSTRFAQTIVYAAGNSIRQIEDAIRTEGINPSKVTLIEAVTTI